MESYAIKAARFFLPGAPTGPGYLSVRDGQFGFFSADEPACEIVDCGDAWVAPGFVDTHIHGFLGHDVMDCDPAGVAAICQGLVKYGVTSWTPTTLTASVDQTRDACVSVADHLDEFSGAHVRGIFLEGPFFTERHKGAQNPAYFLDPRLEVFNDWQQSAHGLIDKVAIASEREGAALFSAQVSAEGVHVALAHSDATYDQAIACVNAGADVFIHTYNGMSPLHHREPGMVGGAMTSHGTYAEAICDGHHLHPIAIKALMDAKGKDHVVLITDCMCAGGMPDGDYALGEFPVTVANGAATLKDGGSLAGSILTLDKAVQNVVGWGLATAEEAIRMATENPAMANGIDDVCGFIRPGYDADYVVLDHDLTVLKTVVSGESVYTR
ncbi:N-acetylglucosamine-6-phosphate deacetylase [Olsenella massiliensis]|uniref:N-acetylglucosamine-6-phosphate deacetylase n=1 Tax=Olsenella massiliensis TaxID=1622075 RepID=UPI00071CB40B|nr:N-acetylglucosamine-6-phosphate deacetylase [Olsenella massiliensis]